MSSPYDPGDPKAPEPIDDLMLRDDDEPEHGEDRARVSSSVREMASRIPESLSAIGRDISRTIDGHARVLPDSRKGQQKNILRMR